MSFDGDNAIHLCLEMKSIRHLELAIDVAGGASCFRKLMKQEISWYACISRLSIELEMEDEMANAFIKTIALVLNHPATAKDYSSRLLSIDQAIN